MTMNSIDPFSQLASQAPAPSERVLQALRKEVKEETTPRRLLSRGQRVLLSCGALALGLTLMTLKAASNSPQVFALALAATSISLGALLFVGAIPGAKMGHRARRLLLAVGGIAVFAVLAMQAEHFLALSSFAEGSHIAHMAKCSGHSILAGILASGALMLIWKRTDPFSPGLTGALLGFFGGLIGTVSVGLACAADEGLHLTLGHGMGTLLLAAVGVLVGRKWLSP